MLFHGKMQYYEQLESSSNIVFYFINGYKKPNVDKLT